MANAPCFRRGTLALVLLILAVWAAAPRQLGAAGPKTAQSTTTSPFGGGGILEDYVQQRNVLLLVVDDVGVDQVPRYIDYYDTNGVSGDEIDTGLAPEARTRMPTVNALADAGVTFVNAWSSPTCSPTRACLYSGQASFRHEVYSPNAPTLPAGTTTIAQVLGAAGYTSGLIGKWHLGETSTDPLGRPHEFGWDYHAGILGGALTSYYDWSRTENGTTNTSDRYATAVNREDAIAWISAQPGPWMATVAFNAPHWASGATAYEMPPVGCAYRPRAGNTDPQVYRSMLECLDRNIEQLLAGIDATVLEQTTIIFMGDNGTEAEISNHFAADHCKSSLYEGGVNVPLIIADGYTYLHGTQSPLGKGVGRVVSPGRYEVAPAQTMDLFATVAQIGSADATCGVDSVSLVPYLQSAAAPPQREAIFAETLSAGDEWDVAVRNSDYKLIVRDYGGSAPAYELYDMTADRWEEINSLADGINLWELVITLELLNSAGALVSAPDACP